MEYKDGTKEHLRGPQYLYFDSVSISRITVCQSEKLEGNEGESSLSLIRQTPRCLLWIYLYTRYILMRMVCVC